MNRGRRLDQKKGVFCLETDQWHGHKDRSSVEPILHLLERLRGYRVPYQHRTVATRGELEYALAQYLNPTYSTHPVLYLAFHGYPAIDGEQSGISLADADLDMGELGAMLEGRCASRVIYFGSCSTLDTHGRRLNSFLKQTKAIAVCGYREDVDWLESTAFDMLFLGNIQWHSLRRRDSLRRFDEELKGTAPGLYRDLGFRLAVRSD